MYVAINVCVLVLESQEFVDWGLGIPPDLLWFESISKKGSQYNCVFYLKPEMCSASVFNEEEYWAFFEKHVTFNWNAKYFFYLLYFLFIPLILLTY